MRKSLWAPCLAISLLGCGGSETPGTVGQAGGTITNATGAKISIPKNALSRDVAITITVAASLPTIPGATGVGSFFELGPNGQTFAVPVEVTLPFDPAKLPSTSSKVLIYTAPTAAGPFGPLESTLVDATHVKATTTHFSTFGAGTPTPMACGTEGAGCNDGVACTKDDRCTGGVCAGTAYTCTSGSICDGIGGCSAAPPELCGNGTDDDGDGLVDEGCTTGGGCTSSAQCTAPKVCVAGVCTQPNG